MTGQIAAIAVGSAWSSPSTKLATSVMIAPAAAPTEFVANTEGWAGARFSSTLESDAAVQLMLTLDRYSGDRLDAALDEARRRFGPAAVTRAVLLGRDSGLVVPLLPD